jgi:hypothetical protein
MQRLNVTVGFKKKSLIEYGYTLLGQSGNTYMLLHPKGLNLK